jgi:RNA-directed DNA polymerase
MKLDESLIEKCKRDFRNMQSKKDFVSLLNYVKSTLHMDNEDNDEYPDFKVHHINQYTFSHFGKLRFKKFEIKKKSGGTRIIHAPHKGLKSILKVFNSLLQCVAITSNNSFGFTPNKSIVDNAKIHTNQNYVYNIDLKDFFFSFDQNRVKMMFYNPPYNIKNIRLCSFMATLVTHHIDENENPKLSDAVLTQGSPASPTLTNMLCYRLDNRLLGLSKRFNLNYSRYADDITFSGQTNVFRKVDFQKELLRIIEQDQNLTLNPKKTRLQSRGNKQEVTGLTVNTKVNVSQKYIKNMRLHLYLCEKYGCKKAAELVSKDICEAISGEKLLEIIKGKIDFIGMVKGKETPLVNKLYKRYFRLCTPKYNFDELIKIWEKEGIDIAMKKYNKDHGQ